MPAAIEVKGINEAVRRLQRLGADLGDLKAVMTRIGGLVATEAKADAPKRRGLLAGSIRPGRSKNKAIVRAGSARVPYAGVIHYGGYHGIEAHPFLTTAANTKRQAVIEELRTGLGALIRTNQL